MTQHELWDELIEALSYNKRGETRELALHRLMQEAQDKLAPEKPAPDSRSAPALTREITRIAAEQWHNRRLARTDFEQTAKEPERTDTPLVVLRLNGEEFLLDGRRRLNKWLREGDESQRRVLVVQADR